MFLSPVSVFSEVAPSDSSEQGSQSVPMVSTSTPGLPVPGAAATGEERDDGLLEPDAERLELLLRRHLILMFVLFRSNLCVSGCFTSGRLLKCPWTQWSLRVLWKSQASNLTRPTCPPPARSLPLALLVCL